VGRHNQAIVHATPNIDTPTTKHPLTVYSTPKNTRRENTTSSTKYPAFENMSNWRKYDFALSGMTGCEVSTVSLDSESIKDEIDLRVGERPSSMRGLVSDALRDMQ
jgi:hypothetical protein